MITYKLGEIKDSDNQVKVTYQNENEEIYERYVNIPRNENGEIDEAYFEEVLNSHLNGVLHKLKVGVIKFSQKQEV